MYKIDGHGRPEPSVGDRELNFSPLPGCQEPPPTARFSFSVGLAVATLIAFEKLRFGAYPQRTRRLFLRCSGNCMS